MAWKMPLIVLTVDRRRLNVTPAREFMREGLPAATRALMEANSLTLATWLLLGPILDGDDILEVMTEKAWCSWSVDLRIEMVLQW